MTIGTLSREKVMLLSVVGLMAGRLLYIDLFSHPTTVPRNTQVPQATRSEERNDRAIPDPKLRIYLLAALRTVEVAADARDLFQFAATETKEAVKQPTPETAIAQNPTPHFSEASGVQQPTPIPLQFYGYTSMRKQSPSRAFFLEGDAIYIAAEGEMIQSQYKVIHVGVNFAVVEDTSSKKQQALRLVESI